MEYYPETIALFKEILKKNFPKLKGEKDDVRTDKPAHLLWMLDQIKSLKGIGKRGRWIGHVNGALVSKKLLDNRKSRETIKRDVANGCE
jgi:hypothetical protein